MVSGIALGLRTEGPWAGLLPLLTKATAQVTGRPAFEQKAAFTMGVGGREDGY